MYRFKAKFGFVVRTATPLIMEGVLARNGEIALFVLDETNGSEIGFSTYLSLAEMLEKRGKCTMEFLDPVEEQ